MGIAIGNTWRIFYDDFSFVHREERMRIKKLLSVLLAICLIAAIVVSCDAAAIQKLGSNMGKLGNNVYGIQPSMDDVDETSSAVVASVTVSEGSVSIDYAGVASVQDAIAEIKNSPQKAEALQEALSEPVASTPAEAAAVKTELEGKRDEVVGDAKTAITAAGLPAEVTDALNTVVDNIQNMVTVSDNPTQAELVTVAVIANLADSIKDNAATIATDTEAQIAVANAALSALDTIKVISGSASIDLLQGVDITSFLEGGKALAKDAGDEIDPKVSQYIVTFNSAIKQIIARIGTDANGGLSEEGYEKFIREMKNLRAVYETAAYAVRRYTVNIDSTPKEFGFAGIDSIIDGVNLAKADSFTVNDITLYMLSFVFTTADEMAGKVKLGEAETSYDIFAVLDSVLEANPSLAGGVASGFQFNEPAVFKQFRKDVAYSFSSDDGAAVVAALEEYFGVDTVEKAAKAFVHKVASVLNAIVVIAVDANYGSLIESAIEEEEADSLEAFLNSKLNEALEGLQ